METRTSNMQRRHLKRSQFRMSDQDLRGFRANPFFSFPFTCLPFCSLITFHFLCVLLLSFPCLWFLLLSFASFLFLFFPCSWFNAGSAGSALIIVPVRVLRRYFPLESCLWLSVPFLTLSFILILHRSFAFLFCHLWFSVGSALISALAQVPRSCRCSILPFPLFPFLSLPFLSFRFLFFPFLSLPFRFFLFRSSCFFCFFHVLFVALGSAQVPRSFLRCRGFRAHLCLPLRLSSHKTLNLRRRNIMKTGTVVKTRHSLQRRGLWILSWCTAG